LNNPVTKFFPPGLTILALFQIVIIFQVAGGMVACCNKPFGYHWLKNCMRDRTLVHFLRQMFIGRRTANRENAVLDAFIIEELKRREQKRQSRPRPRLDLPDEMDLPECEEVDQDQENEDDSRVIIIDYDE